MSRKLENKVAIVTGGAQGIGAACATRLAAEGATVIVADILEERGRAVIEKIQSAKGAGLFVKLDVTSETSWTEMISLIQSKFGALNILINNAGIGRPFPLVDMPYETFQLLFAINLNGMFLGMKHSIPFIQASGGGSIINLSSAASRKPYVNMSAYCASKAGVAHLTKVAALECAQLRPQIRVNSIHPGMVNTPAWDHLGALEGGSAETVLNLNEMAAATVPLGFVGTPDDIANTAIFLCSDDSRYITGAEIYVDGGQVLL